MAIVFAGIGFVMCLLHYLWTEERSEPVAASQDAADKIKFTDDALETILNVPRVFLPLVLKGCVEWARENNCELITAKEMQIINDKRAKEKNKK